MGHLSLSVLQVTWFEFNALTFVLCLSGDYVLEINGRKVRNLDLLRPLLHSRHGKLTLAIIPRENKNAARMDGVDRRTDGSRVRKARDLFSKVSEIMKLFYCVRSKLEFFPVVSMDRLYTFDGTVSGELFCWVMTSSPNQYLRSDVGLVRLYAYDT